MAKPLHLLLVEDDELDRIAVRRALRRTDLEHTLEEVGSVAEAVAEMAGGGYDCTILDYQLPDGDAADLLRDTGGRDRAVRPPVIILTGYGSESVAVELMKAGAADYMPKNELTPSRIGQSLRNALRLRASETALREAYDELERRVVERTAELADANAALERQIADRRRAEDRARHLLEQLTHVARLSTLGEMAATLAHELNQPLGAVSNFANGCIQRLRAGTADAEVLIPILQKIESQAQRAGRIIRRLRAMAGGQGPLKIAADVNQLVVQVVELEGPEALQYEVETALELGAGLPEVQADPIQIQQVILNLLRNGIESMAETVPPRRRLTVTTHRVESGAVEVAVADRGKGCTPEEFERLFDAFFTTKEHGMGLGLAICKSIVEAHGGQLDASANPGGGLTVRFTLPVKPRAGERAGSEETSHEQC